jgi:hypothetical protein
MMIERAFLGMASDITQPPSKQVTNVAPPARAVASPTLAAVIASTPGIQLTAAAASPFAALVTAAAIAPLRRQDEALCAAL